MQTFKSFRTTVENGGLVPDSHRRREDEVMVVGVRFGGHRRGNRDVVTKSSKKTRGRRGDVRSFVGLIT